MRNLSRRWYFRGSRIHHGGTHRERGTSGLSICSSAGGHIFGFHHQHETDALFGARPKVRKIKTLVKRFPRPSLRYTKRNFKDHRPNYFDGHSNRTINQTFHKIHVFIESRHSWSQQKTVDEDTHRELKFWHDNIHIRNGFGIKKNHLTTKVIYSDASADGFGGYIVQRLDKVIAQGKFSNIEKDLSSTHRELLAVVYTIQSFHKLLRNESLLYNGIRITVTRVELSQLGVPNVIYSN